MSIAYQEILTACTNTCVECRKETKYCRTDECVIYLIKKAVGLQVPKKPRVVEEELNTSFGVKKVKVPYCPTCGKRVENTRCLCGQLIGFGE